MEILPFSNFVFEEEEFTKTDLFELIDEFDEDELEELTDFVIDLFDDEEGDDEDGEETEISAEELKALIDELGDAKLEEIITFAVNSIKETEDDLEEAMSTAAKTRDRVRRRKPAHKKAMKKLARCRKAHKNLPDNKACGTDGKIHVKRKLTARKKTRIKRKRLKKRITVK